MNNLLPNSLLFTLGTVTFLCTYSWFRYFEIERFRSNFEFNKGLDGSAFSLFLAFLYELIICFIGVIGSGILFIELCDLAFEIISFLTRDHEFESHVVDSPDYYL